MSNLVTKIKENRWQEFQDKYLELGFKRLRNPFCDRYEYIKYINCTKLTVCDRIVELFVYDIVDDEQTEYHIETDIPFENIASLALDGYLIKE